MLEDKSDDSCFDFPQSDSPNFGDLFNIHDDAQEENPATFTISNQNDSNNENSNQENQIQNISDSNENKTQIERNNYLRKKRIRSKGEKSKKIEEKKSEKIEEKKSKKSEEKNINDKEEAKSDEINNEVKELISGLEKDIQLNENDTDIIMFDKLKKYIVIIFIFYQIRGIPINICEPIHQLIKNYFGERKENDEQKNYFSNCQNIVEKFAHKRKYIHSYGLLNKTLFGKFTEVLDNSKKSLKNDEKKFRIIKNSIPDLVAVLISYIVQKETKESKSKCDKFQKKSSFDNQDFNNNIDNIIDEEISIKGLYYNSNENNLINNINDEVLPGNNTETKSTTYIEKNKKNRKDNLFKLFITMFKKLDEEIKSDEIEMIEKLNKKQYVEYNIKDKETLNSIKEKLNSEKFKGGYFFNEDEEEQKKYYENLKCKNEAVLIFKSLNLDGLIIVEKLVTVEKTKYIKIKNAKEFEMIIKELVDPNFCLNLTDKEKRDISKRKEDLQNLVAKILNKIEEILKNLK